MDILKKAYSNIKYCSIKKDDVEVCGKIYSKKTPVNFTSNKSKDYTLDSIIFYLMNINTPLTEYVEKCQKEKIMPVSYLDQASIREDINNYSGTVVPGFFVQPTYTNNRHYDIPDVRDFYYILVPNDVLSVINIENIEGLLSTGTLSKEHSEPFSKITRDFTFENINFKIINDTDLLSENDWDGVRAVFINDKDYLISKIGDKMAKLCKTSAIFTMTPRSFQSIRLVFENNKLKNYDEVIDEIKRKTFVDSK